MNGAAACVRRTPESCRKRCTAEVGEFGRVEDGRGSLGPVASAPFPILAHRTGRADLRHPALRLASSLGPQQGTSEQAFHTEHAALTVDRFEGALPVSAPL